MWVELTSICFTTLSGGLNRMWNIKGVMVSFSKQSTRLYSQKTTFKGRCSHFSVDEWQGILLRRSKVHLLILEILCERVVIVPQIDIQWVLLDFFIQWFTVSEGMLSIVTSPSFYGLKHSFLIPYTVAWPVDKAATEFIFMNGILTCHRLRWFMVLVQIDFTVIRNSGLWGDANN